MASTLKRVVDNLRTGKMVVRDVGRFRQIVMVLARHGLGHFLERMPVIDPRLLSKAQERREEVDDAVPVEAHSFTVVVAEGLKP